MKETLNKNAQAVLDVVRATKSHPTALEVYEQVKLARPRIGLASVYRILHTLSQQGYINEIGRHDEGCRYDGETTRHDHAVCTTCGTLIDIPVTISVSQELLQDAARAAGIELASHEIRLYGQCPSCLQESHRSAIAN